MRSQAKFSVHHPDAGMMQREQGFTLIEMLISMAMGLVLIAGISSIFIADSNIARTMSSRSERMGDLFLASHLMQEALRESLRCRQNAPKLACNSNPDPLALTAQGVLQNLTSRSVTPPPGYPSSAATFNKLPFWDTTSNTLTYQNLEGNVGIFQYKRTANDRIYWLRPLAAGVSGSSTFQELMRDLDTTNGLVIYDPATNAAVTTALGGGMRVDLQSAYTNENKQGRTLSLSFMAWPRN